MSLPVIDTLKSMGNFPLAEGKDIDVDGKRVDAIVDDYENRIATLEAGGGGGGGTTNYTDLSNKPKINGVELNGNRTSADLKIDKANLGLGNVDNTSDLNKPISTAVRTEINRIDGINGDFENRITALEESGGGGGEGGTSNYNELANKPKINGVELKSNKSLSDLGIVIPTNLSELNNDEGFTTFSGAYSDLTGKPTIPSSKADIGLGNVDNTSDLNKPVSRAVQAELDVLTSSISSASTTATSASTRINALSNRMDGFTTLPTGSTSADAELMDIRVGDDGHTYTNAGSAVREQFKHTKDNLDSIHFHTIASKWRSDIVGDYRIQSFCYDKTSGNYYIIGNAVAKDGSAKLWVTKDLYNPTVEKSAIVQTGHSNDITYCSKNGMLYVACGYSDAEGGGQEGSVEKNVIAEIDASTLTFKRYITISTLNIVSRIEYIPDDDYFVIGDFTHCSTYNTSFTRIKANVFDIGEQTRIDPKYGLDPSRTGSQGIATDGTYLYALFFAITSDWTDGYFIEKFALDGTWVSTNFYSVDRPGQEAEGLIIKNNTLYIIFDGKYFDVYKGMISGDEYKPARWLADNTDLNDVLVLGKHFSQNGTQTNKLVNVPTPAKNAGFILEVEQVGRTNVMQTITVNNVVPTILRRLWLEGIGWGKWHRVDIAKEFKPSSENIFCYGRVYNAQSCRMLIPVHALSMSITKFVITLYGINGQIDTKTVWDGVTHDPTTETVDITLDDGSRTVLWNSPAGIMCTYYPANGVSTAVNTPVTGQVTVTGTIWS